MLDFIAGIKAKIKKSHNVEASYLSITAPWQTGIMVGDTYIFVDKFKNNQYSVRIFASKDVSIKRLDETGDVIVRNKNLDV